MIFCPCLKHLNLFIYRFIKHLSRGWNSCSRCDIEFRPLPDSDLARKRADPSSASARKSSSASGSSRFARDERRDERREGDRGMERPPSLSMVSVGNMATFCQISIRK